MKGQGLPRQREFSVEKDPMHVLAIGKVLTMCNINVFKNIPIQF